MATEHYHHLLDDPGVRGVDDGNDAGDLTVFVETRRSEDEIPERQLIRNRVHPDTNTRVVEAGDPACHTQHLHAPTDRFSASERSPKARHRPVVSGVSEINAELTAATGGLLARVVDPSAAGLQAEEGQLVRVSNMHVYGREGNAEVGEPVVQPSPIDASSTPPGNGDQVGQYLGGVPLADGTPVDASVRSVGDDEKNTIHTIGNINGVETDVSKGQGVQKTGRSSGYTRGTVEATSATVRVGYSGGEKIERTDQYVTTAMSKGGDSGSPVVTYMGDGTTKRPKFVGHIYAGSQKVSLIDKAANIQRLLGIEVVTGGEDGGKGNEGGDEGDEDGNDDNSDAGFIERVVAFLRRLLGADSVSREPRFDSSEREPDIVASTAMADFFIECENNAEAVLKEGVSQALMYAGHNESGYGVPMLVYPDDLDVDSREFSALKARSPVQFRPFPSGFK